MHSTAITHYWFLHNTHISIYDTSTVFHIYCDLSVHKNLHDILNDIQKHERKFQLARFHIWNVLTLLLLLFFLPHCERRNYFSHQQVFH